MIQIQYRITVAEDGTVTIEMDRLEREDVTLVERELAAGLHDLSLAVLQESLGQVAGLAAQVTIIDANGARPLDWRS